MRPRPSQVRTGAVEALVHHFCRDEGEVIVDESLSLPIPEDILVKLTTEELLGAGDAEVEITLTMTTTRDYQSAGARATVRLRVSQDNASLDRAAELATELSERYAAQAHQTACSLLTRTLEAPAEEEEPPRKVSRLVKKSKKPQGVLISPSRGTGKPRFRE